MQKTFKIFQVFGILLMASPTFLLLPQTAGASPGMYLPLVLKSWGGVPSLTVKNSCSFSIWVQQSKEHKLTDTPLIQKIEAGQSFDYAVDPKGIISTRFWPKWGCDAQGENCIWGQSIGGARGADDYPPCPAGGCHAPADSKLEVTWGCAYPDPANNPQCEHKKAQTFYNGSIVDGYSLPFKITRSSDLAGSCQDIDCSGLTMAACPKEDNLRQGKTADHPEYSSVDLRIILGGQETACFSPCKKMNYPQFGGLNLGEQTDAVIMYCCPTPPISSPDCKIGPVPQTQYVTTVHKMCPNTYGYAYDDLLGNFNCHYSTKFTMTFCQ